MPINIERISRPAPSFRRSPDVTPRLASLIVLSAPLIAAGCGGSGPSAPNVPKGGADAVESTRESPELPASRPGLSPAG